MDATIRDVSKKTLVAQLRQEKEHWRKGGGHCLVVIGVFITRISRATKSDEDGDLAP